ncbi:hypothetical protein BD410DRAFT_381079 [Rickenella mellea]|uniref:Uncharacterized protein n=1 Tax=Rickenella mellea TaxID=50990 RepID=A0A4Y7Q0Q1_9AGAM|nr:hypothetical protein BD410DRAFT_381079 [Rickenella mellea]
MECPAAAIWQCCRAEIQMSKQGNFDSTKAWLRSLYYFTRGTMVATFLPRGVAEREGWPSLGICHHESGERGEPAIRLGVEWVARRGVWRPSCDGSRRVSQLHDVSVVFLINLLANPKLVYRNGARPCALNISIICWHLARLHLWQSFVWVHRATRSALTSVRWFDFDQRKYNCTAKCL